MLQGTGLKLERFRELSPGQSEGKLTVSLWLGVKPVAAGKNNKLSPKVEAIA